MCVQKVYVRDILRHGIAVAFNCGRCPACLQEKASLRSRRIRFHKPKDTICYFITLTYKNCYVPYIKKSDIIRNNYLCLHDKDYNDFIPVYRDNTDQFRDKHIIEYVDFDFPVCLSDIKTLKGIRTKLKDGFFVDHNKVSICLTSDFQKFAKRLRTNIFRDFGKNFEFSYYYAPEYGPTSSRFHIHALLWVETSISPEQVRNHVVKAWPYADEMRTRKYIEIARNPAHYVASYVNCSADVSKFLTKNFKLRPTHSNNFGYDEELCSLDALLQDYQTKRSFKFTTMVFNKNGSPEKRSFYFPKYIIRKYFPKLVGSTRLTRNTEFLAYRFPEKYFTLYRSKRPRYRSNGDQLFTSNIIDRNGVRLTFTLYEISYFYKRLQKNYYCYFRPRGYTYEAYINLCIDYNDAYFRQLYYDSQQSDVMSAIRSFFNLTDLRDGKVSAPTITPYLQDFSKYDYCSNWFPEEIERTKQLNTKYQTNIKVRKINHYG